MDDKERSSLEKGVGVEFALMEQARRLGFIETDQMRQIRESLKAIQDLGQFRQRMTEYHILSQAEVDKIPGDDRLKAQTGSILVATGIYHSRGMTEDFELGIRDAADCAYGFGDYDLVEKIVRLA